MAAFSEWDFFEDISQVCIRLESGSFGGFDDAEESGGSVCTVGMS